MRPGVRWSRGAGAATFLLLLLAGSGCSGGAAAGPDAASQGDAGSDAPAASADATSEAAKAPDSPDARGGLDAVAEGSAATDGASGPPSSCQPGGPGLSMCGGGESCCTSLPVTGGTFYRTYDPLDGTGLPTLAPDGGPTGLADPATVSSFRLDKYPVTVGRFRQYVNYLSAGGALPTDGSGKHAHLNGGQGLVNSGSDAGAAYETGWDAAQWNSLVPTSAGGWESEFARCDGLADATWSASPGANEGLPMNCVSWYEAYAFCIWDGGFLPSAAEWEYAAAGGSEQRLYPWGSANPGTASQYAVYDCYYPSGVASCHDEAGALPGSVANIAPVGTATGGAARWGQLDMAGEVDQFTLDFHMPLVNPCSDCAWLTAAAYPSGGSTISLPLRVTQGGDFSKPLTYLPVPNSALNTSATLLSFADGVRCARSP